MNYQAVIFDLFGTLVDDFVTGIGEMNRDLIAALDAPSESFSSLWRETAEMRSDGAFQTVEDSIAHVCAMIGLPVSTERMAKAVEVRLRYTGRALEPRPNALATITQLKTLGHKIGLISNCSIEMPILWPNTAFTDLFDAALFSSRERLKKPDPRIFRTACERLGVAPERSLYVADGENYELAAARSVGLHPVLIRNAARDRRKELFREAREWNGLAIDDLSELIQIVTGALK
ncbi:MAG TPA: HAD-IA family hydrolase [Candidatus Binatia bacterium]|jgi:putative hydrolase of the HAD superfamily